MTNQDDDRTSTCKQCNEHPVCYSHQHLCVGCYLQLLVDDGEHSEAYTVAVIEGVDAGQVQTMIREAHERTQRLARVDFPRDPELDARAEQTRDQTWSDLDSTAESSARVA